MFARRHLGLVARILFGMLGVAFLVVAFLATWDDAQRLEWPPPHLIFASLLLIGVGLWSAYRAWATLLEVRPSAALQAGFYLSQLGKYLPGGVWQALAQVGYAVRTGVPTAQAGTRLVVFGLTQAAGGALVGAALIALGSGISDLLRVASVVPAIALFVLLDRRWMLRLVRWWQSRRGLPARDELIPGQGAILRACAWSAGTLLMFGAAFALLLEGTAGGGLHPSAVPAFALAWTIGFLALPFPAGLGIREAVLVVVLVALAPTATIIAAAVFLRLAAIVAEVVAIALSLLLARLSRRARPGAGLRRPRHPLPPPELRFMGEDDATFVAIGDALAELLEREAGLGRRSRLLDLGCGYGRLAHALGRRGFRGRYLGIDVLERQIDWCDANLGSRRFEFRRADIRNERYNPGGAREAGDLDLGDESFDVVALLSVFTHMWPEDVSAYLRLVASTLAPEGRALATFFLLDDEWRRLEAERRPEFRLPRERTAFCRYESEREPLHRVGYELDWVLAAAREAGLEPAGPPIHGSWSGRAGASDYQDAVVFERLSRSSAGPASDASSSSRSSTSPARSPH